MIPRRRFRPAIRRTAATLTVALALLGTGGLTAGAGPEPPPPARTDPFPSETWPVVPPTGPPSRIADDVIRDLGAPISSLTIMEGVVSRAPDGRDVIYAVPAGENARLNVVDLHSRQLLHAVPLPGAAGAWAITVASDGSVYVGSYANAHLYRYDPTTATVEDLGQPIPGESSMYGLTADENGAVYAGTYPNTHAFKYDHATRQVTDYGRMDPVQQYARATVYDPDHNALFVGLSTPQAKVWRIDLNTGEKREITPPGLTAKDIIDLDYAANRVFANASGRLVVFDATTGERVSFHNRTTGTTVDEYPIAARGVSPDGPGGVYFTTNTLELARYDPATDTVGLTTPPVRLTRGASIGYGWVTENGQQVLYGLAGNYSGGTFRYDPATGALSQWSSPFQYVPVALMHTIADPSNGKVFVNAFLNGSTGVYDPATGRTTLTARQGQVEGWAWDSTGSKLYVGVYPYGRLSLWDPKLPESSTNPRELFSLVDSHYQNRPVSVVATGNRVYVGTTPSYGEYGGALTVYDIPTGGFTVYRNLVVDQTIASIQPYGANLWLGSGIEGGQGTEPRATEARLALVDPLTGVVKRDVVPVPGADSINELSIGPDGKLWGLADGTVFVANPVTGRVLRTIEVFDARTGANDGALSWRDGYLYGVTGGHLFVIDSLGAEQTVLRPRGLNRLTQTPDGTYYTLLRPDGWSIPTNLASYTPPIDPCPASDLRPTVWTGNINSYVQNRHLRYGCTLSDELPDATRDWPSHIAYVRAVDQKVRELERADLITRWEGLAIRLAAIRSDVGR